MSLETRLHKIAINNAKPVTKAIIDYENNLNYFISYYGKNYLGRESHLVLMAYKVTEKQYENYR